MFADLNNYSKCYNIWIVLGSWYSRYKRSIFTGCQTYRFPSLKWRKQTFCLFVCLFVCLFLSLSSQLRIFLLLWRRHHCQWRVANFDIWSALTGIEQWGFFNGPHPLRNGPTVDNGNLRGPATLIPVAKRLEVELSLSLFTT